MSSSSQVVESWISSFCGLLGHEFFAEVSEDFIEDDFNLTGLSNQVPLYKEALEMILDVEPEEDEDDEDEDEDIYDDDDQDLGGDDINRPTDGNYHRGGRRQNRLQNDLSVIESSAELLYGLIHQRYITSRPGIGQMQEKYDAGHFGQCPRVLCSGARVLPVGISDMPDTDTVKLFCPSCLDVYTPPNSRFQSVDGAFFGTTFGCLFLMTFPELQVAGLSRHQASESPPQPQPTTDDAVSLTSGRMQLSPNGGPSSSRSRSTHGTLPAEPAEINGVPTPNFAPGLGEGYIYEPRIYGFRVSERAKSGPRMQWLRMKPYDVTVLDEAEEAARQEFVEEIERDSEMEGVEDQDQQEEEHIQHAGQSRHAAIPMTEEQDGVATASLENRPSIGETMAAETNPAPQGQPLDPSQRKKAPVRRRTKRSEGSEGLVDMGIGVGDATANGSAMGAVTSG